MLKLGRRARGHFMTLIEIRVHLIRVKPGHISLNLSYSFLRLFLSKEVFKKCFQSGKLLLIRLISN